MIGIIDLLMKFQTARLTFRESYAMIIIKVKDIVGTNAISMNSGGKLLGIITTHIDRQEVMQLDFDGIEVFASPFFNASIGALLKNHSIEDLQKFLKFVNISETGRELLNLVIRNAIKFYADTKNATRNGINEASKDM